MKYDTFKTLYNNQSNRTHIHGTGRRLGWIGASEGDDILEVEARFHPQPGVKWEMTEHDCLDLAHAIRIHKKFARKYGEAAA